MSDVIQRMNGKCHGSAAPTDPMPTVVHREILDAATNHACPAWICFSGQDWWYHNRAHSDFQLMVRIARSRQVLFVNSIGMRMPIPGRSTKPGRRILRKIGSVMRFLQRPLREIPDFHVFTPFILPFYGSKLMRVLNAGLVRLQVRMVAKRVGIELRRATVFLTVPTAWEVISELPHRALLYNRSDLHSAFEETNQDYIRELEHKLFDTSDVVLYVSHALMDAERSRVGNKVFFLDHGVDFQRFAADSGPEPADLAVIPHPRVGFFGGIDDYVVDLDLIAHVARAIPESSIVLIGDATCSMARFDNLPNVHWLGFQPYELIPAYGRHFDVALMPWLRNEWIAHSNPIKLKEYLAIGLPVVSTDFPEAREYSDVIAIASNYGEFVDLVRAAIAGRSVGSETIRRDRVAELTWDKQAERLLALGEAIRR